MCDIGKSRNEQTRHRCYDLERACRLADESIDQRPLLTFERLERAGRNKAIHIELLRLASLFQLIACAASVR